MSTSLTVIAALFLFACEGPAGTNGVDGVDGSNGSDGVDGVDGVDGSDGSDGSDGVDGVDGVDGEGVVGEPTALDLTITSVDVSGTPVVSFMVTDQDGEGFDGLTQDLVDDRAMRWSIAKLTPGEDGDPDTWQSYINTTEDTTASTAGPDDTPVLASATQATYEYSGTLSSLGDGAYTYTYGNDITAVTDPITVDYDEALLHRVATQLSFTTDSGESLSLNQTFDWVPSGDDAPATRKMVSTETCNECHGELAVHGSRTELDYCVVCHNPGSADANSGNSVDMTVMVHKIHMGNELTAVEDGGTYTIWGYRDGEHDYSHVGYPQDQQNCIKCHNPDDKDTPDAGNYLDRPTMDACGSCHDAIDWDSGDNHDGGAMSSNASCSLCHTADSINTAHLTENATPNNPDLPDDLVEIEYELLSASVDDDNVLAVEFKIYSDGVELDLTDLPEDLATPERYPGLLLAWASSVDGHDSPADWNNLGNDSAQPTSIGLDELISGDEGQLTYSGGTNTATIPDAFPEDGMMRTVALQGYFRQLVDDEEYGRHAISVHLTVDGDDERREVVDPEGCASCHEWFEGHGGNRNYETQVCAMCHNPNLSSGGREIDLDYPEASNNLKDLIHGIHGASVRDYPLDFVRNRSGGSFYTFLGDADQLEDYPDGHVVEYPNDPAQCMACHLDGTFLPESVPSNAIESNVMMGPDAADIDEYADLRETVPNEDDMIMGPVSASCNSCHNSDLATAHMDQNGGSIMWYRWELLDEEPVETCAICHGEGGVAATDEAHGQ